MTITRSAISATTPMSCVMRMMAVPNSSWRVFIRSRICACTVTSSAVVGSSAISTLAARQGHGDHHPLAHAARELVRIAPDLPKRLRDLHPFQHDDGPDEGGRI